jgi:hypothetical protein
MAVLSGEKWPPIVDKLMPHTQGLVEIFILSVCIGVHTFSVDLTGVHDLFRPELNRKRLWYLGLINTEEA